MYTVYTDTCTVYRSVISAGDVYNFHFIKRDEVLFVEDEEGKTFSIPLNSSIKFGLLQRPFRNMRNLREFKYKMVGDLATGCEPPLLVKATQNFNSGEAISSVEAEEVLIVKKIHRTRHYKLYVEAFSLCTCEQYMYRRFMHAVCVYGVRLHSRPSLYTSLPICNFHSFAGEKILNSKPIKE